MDDKLRPDPTKDPEFQKVVKAFLTTKPKLHKTKTKQKKRTKKPLNMKG